MKKFSFILVFVAAITIVQVGLYSSGAWSEDPMMESQHEEIADENSIKEESIYGCGFFCELGYEEEHAELEVAEGVEEVLEWWVEVISGSSHR